MSKTLEFFFDLGSPATYLAYTQLPALCAKTGAQVVYQPMLLGGVFKATGNQSPISIPAKGRYTMQDFARFARRYGVPMAFNPHFPINTLTLMRGAAGYLGSAQFERYLSAIFEAMWVNKKNLGKPEVVAEVITRAGLDPAEFARLVSDEEVKERLKGITEQAIQRGAFGAPTFFVGEEMFFGQDRLDFVAEALQRD